MKKAMNIPRARQAVDKEWDKPFDMVTLDLDSVEPREKVRKEYKVRKEPVHSSSLRTMCHEKNAEIKTNNEGQSFIVAMKDTIRTLFEKSEKNQSCELCGRAFCTGAGEDAKAKVVADMKKQHEKWNKKAEKVANKDAASADASNDLLGKQVGLLQECIAKYTSLI